MPPIVDRRARAMVCVMAVIAALTLPSLLGLVGLPIAEGSLAVQGGVAIIAGLLAGPVTGCLTGVLTTIVAFIIAGPSEALGQFALVELAVSGLAAGLMARHPIRPLCAVVLAQAAGRLAHLIASAVHADELQALMVAIGDGWASVRGGLVAILLQWLVIPPIISLVHDRATRRRAADRARTGGDAWLGGADGPPPPLV